VRGFQEVPNSRNFQGEALQTEALQKGRDLTQEQKMYARSDEYAEQH